MLQTINVEERRIILAIYIFRYCQINMLQNTIINTVAKVRGTKVASRVKRGYMFINFVAQYTRI